MLKVVFSVALGGALGAVVRYLVAYGFARLSFMRGMPFGTLTVNLLGSFAIGLMVGLVFRGRNFSDALYAGIVAGFLGSLTTFSAFVNDYALALIGPFSWLNLLYVLSMLVGGLLFWRAGYFLAFNISF